MVWLAKDVAAFLFLAAVLWIAAIAFGLPTTPTR